MVLDRIALLGRVPMLLVLLSPSLVSGVLMMHSVHAHAQQVSGDDVKVRETPDARVTALEFEIAKLRKQVAQERLTTTQYALNLRQCQYDLSGHELGKQVTDGIGALRAIVNPPSGSEFDWRLKDFAVPGERTVIVKGEKP